MSEDGKRVSVTFSAEAYSAVTEIAERTGKSVSHVLRDALAFERWYRNVIADGGRVLVERGNRLAEVVRP